MTQTTNKHATRPQPLRAAALPLLAALAILAGCAQPGIQVAGLESLLAWRPHVAPGRGAEQLERDRLECAQRAVQAQSHTQSHGQSHGQSLTQAQPPSSQSLSTAVVHMRSCLINKGYVLLN